jgi:hypothetical protein
VHGAEALDMTMHSSLTLGRRENAPRRLSEKGYQEMHRDPVLEALRQKNLDTLDAILEAHGSTKKAEKVDGVDYRFYKEAARAYDVARQAYVKAAYTRELRNYFQQDCSSDQQCYDNMGDESDNFGERSDGIVSPALNGMLQSTYDETTMPDFSDEHEAAIADFDLSLVDPAIPDPIKENIHSLLAVAVVYPTSHAEAFNTDAVNSSEGLLTKLRQTQRSKTITMAVTILDSVSEELLKDETTLTDSRLANLMVSSFRHMFPSDSFFPGQEPLPGTTNCRFCNQDFLADNKRRAAHAFWCSKKAMMKEIMDTIYSEYTALYLLLGRQ